MSEIESVLSFFLLPSRHSSDSRECRHLVFQDDQAEYGYFFALEITQTVRVLFTPVTHFLPSFAE